MLLPTVAIEVADAGATPSHVDTMVAACTRALPEGRCALAGELGPPGAATVTAIVTWDGYQHQRARIEVGSAVQQRATWTIRELAFEPQDDDPERWRAVGLVIATLASRSREADAVAPPPDKPKPASLPAAPAIAPRAAAIPTPTPPAPRPSVAWIDAAGLLAPALDDGSWRFGAQVRGALSLRVVPVFGLVSLRYAVRPEDDLGLGVQWATGGVGAGLHVQAGPDVAIQPHAELLAERVAGSVRDASAAEDAGSRWVGGARFGIDVAWSLRPLVSLFAGADATVLQSDTVITVRGAPVGRAPGFGFSPLLGIRLNVP